MLNDKYREAGAVDLESDRFVRIEMRNGYFYQVCCDCGLVHRVHIGGKPEKITIRFERLDDGLPVDDVISDGTTMADLAVIDDARG